MAGCAPFYLLIASDAFSLVSVFRLLSDCYVIEFPGFLGVIADLGAKRIFNLSDLIPSSSGLCPNGGRISVAMAKSHRALLAVADGPRSALVMLHQGSISGG